MRDSDQLSWSKMMLYLSTRAKQNAEKAQTRRNSPHPSNRQEAPAREGRKLPRMSEETDSSRFPKCNAICGGRRQPYGQHLPPLDADAPGPQQRSRSTPPDNRPQHDQRREIGSATAQSSNSPRLKYPTGKICGRTNHPDKKCKKPLRDR